MVKNKIWRRLSPLYVSSFFQGLVFWYAIEKVFMVHIGFTPTTIALQVIIMASTGLLLEVPSGILADRWSRKGVLIMACLALVSGSLLLGLSHTVVEYLLASVLYGIYFSLHSGTYDAMIYDTLIEEQDSREGYEKYLGNATLIASIGLIIGSLLGGVVGNKFGLSSAYFLSIPGGLIAVIAAFKFKEPKLHKAGERIKLLHHTTQTLRVVFQKGFLAWVVVTLLATSIVYSFLLELDQLWPLALKLHLPWYGPLNALLLLGYGLGGPIAALLIKRRPLLVLSYVLALLAVCLLVVRDMPIIAFAQFGVLVLYIGFSTIALGRFHDALPAHLRSSSSSVVNALINIAFIPLIFIFGRFTQRYTVFHAAYMLIPLAIISVVGMIITSRRHDLALNSNLIEKPHMVPSTSIGQ
jgi:MFS family permease